MYYLSIIHGLKIFLLVLTIHIITWNRLRPKNDMNFLFFMFLVLPAISFLLIPLFSLKLFLSYPEKILAVYLPGCLLYFSLACAYIQTYPAFQADAPSLKIMRLIHKSGTLTGDKIINSFSLENLVQDRVDDLVKDGFISVENGKYYLKPKGKLLAIVFYHYRKLYGLNFGEG